MPPKFDKQTLNPGQREALDALLAEILKEQIAWMPVARAGRQEQLRIRVEDMIIGEWDQGSEGTSTMTPLITPCHGFLTKEQYLSAVADHFHDKAIELGTSRNGLPPHGLDVTAGQWLMDLHVELMDQVSPLETTAADLAHRIEELEGENILLRDENADLRAEVELLRAELGRTQNADSDNNAAGVPAAAPAAPGIYG